MEKIDMICKMCNDVYDIMNKEMSKKLRVANNVINEIGNNFLELVKSPMNIDKCIDPLEYIILLNGAEIFDKYNYEELNTLITGIVRYRKSLNSFFDNVIKDINNIMLEKEKNKEKPLEDMTREELLEYIKNNK